MVFIGTYTHTFDAKGRVFVPKKYLHDLTTPTERVVYVGIGMDPCVMLFSKPHFDALSQQIIDLPQTDPAARNYTQIFFENTFDVEVDSAGRILIPEVLREHANMKMPGGVVFAGAGTSVTIWDPTIHATHRAGTKPNYAIDAAKAGGR
ncbi:MAG: division/cell wall cluster transcriptional repressor MraZ [Planctomycetes bacterium]|nr:division/cell wall cluster transcriptional repressor MraZ [Planctomycetota bacterium]